MKQRFPLPILFSQSVQKLRLVHSYLLRLSNVPSLLRSESTKERGWKRPDLATLGQTLSRRWANSGRVDWRLGSDCRLHELALPYV